MIRYNLHCDQGHAFESWFQSSAAYETQEKRKLVNCPACGSVKVERAIMAPQIVSKKVLADSQRNRDGQSDHVPAPAQPAEGTASGSTPLLMAQERELRAKLKELRDHIVKNADNVGERFPNEAREHALRRQRAPSDLRRGLAGRSAVPDRRGRRGVATASVPEDRN